MLDLDSNNVRILMVDDQESNLLLLESLLETEGFTQVKAVTDSRHVLVTFSEFQPDLVLLDQMMPHLDGFAVLNELRRVIPSDDYRPILVLTADVSKQAKQRALELGAKDFLTKPLDHIEVVLRIKNLLETRAMHLYQQNQNQLLEQLVRERTAQLESESRRMELILQSVQEGIYGLDLDGRITFVNRAAAEMLGSSSALLIGQNAHAHHDRGNGSVHARTDCVICAAFRDGKNHDAADKLFWRRDGTSFPVRFTSAAMRDDSGALIGAVVTFENISARKRAEQAQRLNSAMLENVGEGIYLVRASDGVIVQTNPKFDAMFGYAPGQVIGMYESILNAPTERSPRQVAESIIAALEKTGVWQGKVLSMKKDGTHLWCYATISTFDDATHSKVWVVARGDISERKHAAWERTLRHAARDSIYAGFHLCYTPRVMSQPNVFRCQKNPAGFFRTDHDPPRILHRVV